MQKALERALQHWGMVAPLIGTPKSQEDYNALLINLKDALTLAENRSKTPLSSLIKAMAIAANEYEGKVLVREKGPVLALKYLIELHSVKQSELGEVGSQGVVSEILSGKRALTVRHVRALAKKFNVSPNVFIDTD